jgi:succinate dehydrogenase / fumarate reductase cytochrome b subunit
MADVNRGNRPLSPHLQIYRMYVTMVASGLHRITGFGMIVTAVLVVWWFIAAATSPEYFAIVDGILTSWIGTLVMLVSLWGMCHHMLNGIRHLIWDTGRMLDPEAVDKTAWFVLLGAPALASLAVLIVLLG